MSTTPTLFPPLKWAQRHDLVLLTIELQDSRNVKLQLPRGGAALSFTCDVPDAEVGDGGVKHYACEFDLFLPVSPEESDFVVRPRQIELKLRKKVGEEAEEEETFWPRLTKEKAKNTNITIDWARWKDEDDDQEAEMDMGDFGFGGSGFGGDGNGDGSGFTEEMMQQFAVNQGNIGAEDARDAAGDEDDDLPPLEEDA